MPTAKLTWRMNPNVESTLRTVRSLKDIAYAYHSASDKQVRAAAKQEWDETIEGRRDFSRSVRPRKSNSDE